MGKKLTRLIGSLLLSLSLVACTQPSSNIPERKPSPPIVSIAKQDNIKKKLDDILLPYSKGIQMSVKVVSLKDGKTVYEYKADDKLIPASCAKIMTAATTLKKLGIDYKFKTELYTDKEINDGIVEGNLYVKGYGDPYLVSEELWLIVNDLKVKGVKEINGDLIADTSFFDDKKYGPGHDENTAWADYSRSYNAPNGALSLNFNTINIHVKPGKNSGDEAIITLDPKTSYPEVINKVKTGGYTNFNASRVKDADKDTIIVEGYIRKNDCEYVRTVNISKPDEYFLTVFKEFLEQEGIKVKGGIKTAVLPEGCQKILTHESRPLDMVIRSLCKFSNNFVADQLVKTLGADIKGVPGSNDKGIEVIKEYLGSIGVKNVGLVDGSGYSTKNKLSASQLVKVLEEVYKDFEVYPHLVSAFSISGTDGTLDERLRNIKGKVKAKTGMLIRTGVDTISGYTETKNGILAFSILMNSDDIDVWTMQSLQDKVLTELARAKY